MKLRNKKTGEIREIREILIDGMFKVSSLAELSEEWEDYEEQKKYWYLTDAGCLCQTSIHNDKTAIRKRIGNYFETKEEAEKAVEKLKAWKRLKDKGFRLGGWQFLDDKSGIWVCGNTVPNIVDELDLLFGGEE